MKALHKINPEDLIDMSIFAHDGLVRIELAYAQDDNLLFGEKIYRENARLWLHSDLTDIVVHAAKNLQEQNLKLVLYDGLRTHDAQARMLETRAVKENPHWLEEPRLLSPPGAGAHPRGMAIDCSLETMNGELLDMGTAFDFLAKNPAPTLNPAHREYAGHSETIMKNRLILDQAMMEAAQETETALFPLPQEWWDFRLPPEVYETYEALKDTDLPPDMRMCD